MISSLKCVSFLLFASCVLGPAAPPAQRLPNPAVFNVTDYGAAADGKTLCTKAIQKTVEACAAAGGGTVYFPAGKYLSGAIFLKSNVTLHIGAGATLLASANFADFPPFKPSWAVRSDDTRLSSLITGLDLENIAVIGRGKLDGQGKPWWDAQRADRQKKAGEKRMLGFGRPKLINLYRCRNVLIQGVTMVDSPSWTVHPVGCEGVVVEGISIVSPDDSPNTDGINPESCRNVRISDCFIDTGDDCITLKSGQDEEGRLKGRATENVTITNCVMYHGHGAVVIGSEMSGGVRNVAASNIVCDGTQRAVRIKSARGRGGVVENIRFDNWTIRNVAEPISITGFYTKSAPEPVSERTPVFRDIAISHFTILDSPLAARILGLSEMPVERLRITDLAASTQTGFLCDSAKGLEMHNVDVEAKEGAPFVFVNCTELELDRIKCRIPPANQPVIRLENTEKVFIRGCWAYAGTGDFLEVLGEATKGIFLIGNHLAAAHSQYVLRRGAQDGSVLVR